MPGPIWQQAAGFFFLTDPQYAEAERKGKEDKARSEAKTKAEENLLTLVQSKAPTAAKALSRMGAHGRGFLIEQAYKAYAELMAQGRPHGLEAIADELEVRMRRDYPEWAPAAPAEGASSGTVTPIGSKKPSALSNASTTKAPPPKPLSQMSEDERWAQYSLDFIRRMGEPERDERHADQRHVAIERAHSSLLRSRFRPDLLAAR